MKKIRTLTKRNFKIEQTEILELKNTTGLKN